MSLQIPSCDFVPRPAPSLENRQPQQTSNISDTSVADRAAHTPGDSPLETSYWSSLEVQTSGPCTKQRTQADTAGFCGVRTEAATLSEAVTDHVLVIGFRVVLKIG